MKLVCHIGTPKTASTYLQNTCQLNKDWLVRHGILYPDLKAPDANHITLFFAAAAYIHDFARHYGLHTPEDVVRFREEMSEVIGRQVTEAPDHIHTMLMSSENLTGNIRSIEGVRGLASLLQPHFDEVRIIVYLRRQDSAMLSMYAEYMRRGFSGPTFDQFLDRQLSLDTDIPYLDYQRMLTNWIEVFGLESITVRLFDRAGLRDGDVLVDFLAQVLAPSELDLAELVPSSESNVSLSAPALEFLRRLHPFLPFRQEGVENPERARLQDRINQLPESPRPELSAAQSARITDYFRAGNDWLGRTFFPDRDGPVFPDRTDLSGQGNMGCIELDEFARFTAHMLVR